MEPDISFDLSHYVSYRQGALSNIKDQLPEESPLTIKVNSDELATLMCSPKQVNFLVAGFLYLQGVINNLSEIDCIRVCDQELVAEVITTSDYDCTDFRQHKAVSSGCTGGVMSLKLNLKPLEDNVGIFLTFGKIFQLMKKLYDRAENYRLTGGIHSSAISIDGQDLLAHAEDIGRHNTIDKLAGEFLIRGFNSKGGVLLSTGRISSEMVSKAVRMEIPIIVSRTSPTTLAVGLAQELGITLVGYVRAGNLKIYTHPWRIKTEGES